MWATIPIVLVLFVFVIAVVALAVRSGRALVGIKKDLSLRGYDVLSVRKESEWPIDWRSDAVFRKYRICFTNCHGDLVEADCYLCGRRGAYTTRARVVQRGADAPDDPALTPLRQENFRLRERLKELQERTG